MDPTAPQPTNANPSSTPTDYHTAYCGFSLQKDGSFSHFSRAINSSHMEGGYWRYKSVEDDRIAIAYGFTKPEDLLLAVDNDEDCEEYDDITLLWVKGPNDPNLRGVLSGTVSQHLRIIYEIRQLLGLPISSRRQIPAYPVSTDPRLKLYWNEMYEGKSSPPIFFRPFQVINQTTLLEGPKTSNFEHLQYVARVPPSHRYMQSERTLEMPAPTPDLATKTPLSYNHPSATASALQQPLPEFSSVNFNGIPESAAPRMEHAVLGPASAVTLPQPPSDSPHGIPAASAAFVFGRPSADPNTIPSNPAAPSSYCFPAPFIPSTDIGTHMAIPASCTESGMMNSWQPSDLEQMAQIPCMSCGTVGSHNSDCPLGNLNFMNDLSILDYRVLTDAVEQFDPGPTTTHFHKSNILGNNQKIEPEDPRVQIVGLAEVIRSEDSYKNDPKLHGLRDDLMIILWAFKTCEGIEILEYEASCT